MTSAPTSGAPRAGTAPARPDPVRPGPGGPRPGTVATAGIVLAGTHPEHDPAGGLEQALRILELAETLEFDLAGVRQRHAERGISSALTVLAAASQRTRRIRLESAVVPIGWATPFQVAEAAGTVDALSGGRLELGVSTSSPHRDLLAGLARGETAETAPDPYALLDRLLEALEGRPLADAPIATPAGPQIPRVQPHAPGLRDRVWLGGGSDRSIAWAADRGLRLLLGNVVDVAGEADGARGFEAVQRAQVDRYRAAAAAAAAPAVAPAVGVERVIVPLDTATADQRAHYRAFAAERDPRAAQTLALGDRAVRFQRDLVGSSDEIVDRLRADPVIDGLTELRVALPYGFAPDEYRQILADIRERVLPALDWSPAPAAARNGDTG